MLDFDLRIKPISSDSFLLTGKIEDTQLIEDLKKQIDKGVKKNHNNYKTNVKGKMTSFKYFNDSPYFRKLIDILGPYIRRVNQHDLQLIDAWGNILEAKDYVALHNHKPSDISGVLYLSSDKGTYFEHFDEEIKAEPGKFVLFDSRIRHEVRQGFFKTKRYSLAFNFKVKNDYEGETH